MHPLMYAGLLPDSRQVSRDAAERHARTTVRRRREDAHRPRFRAWRPLLQS
ncbi:hypothetical protein [Microbacterium terregens]|uniref:Uncharacterized protein n=1 Tax=Microbacterium terregens TaxID=69363 RepID=A0ABV5T0Y0_9MICO